MTFLNAWAVGFAAIAPVIVLLYLLKLKRRPVPVSTLLFWQRILQESRRRALFQRLRQLFSLLLHLLIFALILGALARPTFDRRVADGASTVLILDTRARMQAVESDGQTRFAKARSAAAGLLRQAGPLRQMALLTAGAEPGVGAPFSDDEKFLRERLDRLAPSDAGGDLAETVRLADALLSARQGERRIVVLTDRAFDPTALSPAAPLEIVAVGSARDNLAITRFATRPLLTSPQTSEVLLEVANFGRALARVNVELAFDGRLLDVKPLSLEPGARAVQIFPTIPRPAAHARGWLTARLDTSDALALDNVAYAVLPVRPPRRVLLVTKGNWFLEKLLAAEQGLAFELIAPDAFTPGLAEKFDAVLCDNFLPPNFEVAQTSGNFFFLKQTPFNTGAPALVQPLISDLDSAHPATRLVNLQNVTFLQAAALAAPALEGWSWQTPIRSFDHPILLTGERLDGTRRVAALALDVTDSDLPLRVAFPLLISNTLHWLAGGPPVSASSLRSGEMLTLAPGETLGPAPQSPWAQASEAPRAPGGTGGPPVASGGPPDAFGAATKSAPPPVYQLLTNGFYEIRARDGARWVAVNTFRDEEADLRGAISSPSPEISSPLRLTLAPLTAWPLWQLLAAAAFLLLALEWWLFHRRSTE